MYAIMLTLCSSMHQQLILMSADAHVHLLAALYLLLGEPMLPYAQGWSLFLLWVCAHIGGFIAIQVGLPPLLGMLIVGIILKNIPQGGHALLSDKCSCVQLEHFSTFVSSRYTPFSLAHMCVKSGFLKTSNKNAPISFCLFSSKTATAWGQGMLSAYIWLPYLASMCARMCVTVQLHQMFMARSRHHIDKTVGLTADDPCFSLPHCRCHQHAGRPRCCQSTSATHFEFPYLWLVPQCAACLMTHHVGLSFCSLPSNHLVADHHCLMNRNVITPWLAIGCHITSNT